VRRLSQFATRTSEREAQQDLPSTRPVRLAYRPSDPAFKAILDPRQLLRWVFIGRLCLASAIFVAAIFTWTNADATKTLIASLAFALSALMTVVSAGYIEIYRRPITSTFLYLQAVFDLLLVTTVVHLTNGSASPFAALYILVIATACSSPLLASCFIRPTSSSSFGRRLPFRAYGCSSASSRSSRSAFAT
jgi:hypothetical protein